MDNEVHLNAALEGFYKKITVYCVVVGGMGEVPYNYRHTAL